VKPSSESAALKDVANIKKPVVIRKKACFIRIF
jgi:hypothetical protein